MPTFDAAAPRPVLQYDGRIAELYRIFLVNLLLNIVTIGIWRFWAITRTRRYLWSRTSLCGSRFEYDGTGGQLFVGFLLAILVIFGLILAAAILVAVLRSYGAFISALPLLLMEFCIIVLAFGAVFSAQRYRLSHTVWRGIRFGMQGSMITYGLRSLLYYLLTAVTLYQLAPWATLRLLERRINATSFGNQRFASRGRPGRLYIRFLLTFLGVAGLGLVVFGIVFGLERGMIAAAFQSPQRPPDPHAIRMLTLVLVPAYLVFALGAALISAGYSAAFFRHVTSHTSLAGLRFSSPVNAATVLSLVMGNALILLFTLGLGMPIVIHRNARYFTTNLHATGTLDLDALQQTGQPVSRFGEGMFQALDAGAGIM
jgi:uncharacterized membrane protein YjgN (DUF898 family)